MPPSSLQSPLRRVAKTALALDILLSLGALGGGAALMLGPRGEILPLPLSALRGSPFDTYFVPGLILFSILGLGPLAAARLAWLRHPLAPLWRRAWSGSPCWSGWQSRLPSSATATIRRYSPSICSLGLRSPSSG